MMKNLLMSLALTASLLSLGGLTACGGTSNYSLQGTDKAIGTDGTVQVETIDGGNSMVTVQLKFLAPADRIESGAKHFVVWFYVPGKDAPIKAGALQYDAETREGRMMATTPEKKFTVTVTAESQLSVTAPSDVVVAKQRVRH